MTNNWYEINKVEELVSPALVVYPERIQANIKLMIQMAGGTDSLRPHIKTHKMAEIIELQLKQGINKFKCATIAEAGLLAKCGAKDILLAMQPIGINVKRFVDLIIAYPDSSFSTIVDNEESIVDINAAAAKEKLHISLWLDINNGMNRTGIVPNKAAALLYQKITSASHLQAKGFHVYDGHIHESDFDKRKDICDQDFEAVLELKKQIEENGIVVETIVAGGTATFPIHVKREQVEASPGTTLLWDQRYMARYQDLKFLPAAVLLGAVLSKPNDNLVCLNLGHKSVAAEMEFPRLKILNFKSNKQLNQSEEHLVVESEEAEELSIGAVCYAIPTHICPTVIKYEHVLTVVNGKVTGQWRIAARDHISS